MSPAMSRRRFFALGGCAGVSAVLPAHLVWPAKTDRSSLRLVFFTDVHARTEWHTPLALKMAAKAVNRAKADLVIAGGDLINRGFQSRPETVEPRWQTYLEMHEAVKPEVWPVLGNHDLVAAMPEDGAPASEDPRLQFKKHFDLKSTYRSFDAGGYHLILLDSVKVVGGDLKYEGRINDEQLGWLRADLEKVDSQQPIIVATHLPLLTAFYQATRGANAAAPANRVVTNNREVLALFENHNLLLVLQGHLHVDELLRWRGTTFITGGAVCGKWWRGAWHGTQNGFGIVTLRPDGVEWQYQTYGWTPRRPE